jgi:hypothetical protein
MPDADPVAARLAEIKERAQGEQAACARHGWEASRLCADAIAVVSAVEAVLALAGEWETRAAEIASQIELQDCDGALAGFKMIGSQGFRDSARDLQAAISAELLGKDGTGDE